MPLCNEKVHFLCAILNQLTEFGLYSDISPIHWLLYRMARTFDAESGKEVLWMRAL